LCPAEDSSRTPPKCKLELYRYSNLLGSLLGNYIQFHFNVCSSLFLYFIIYLSRSQFPRGLRHELFSHARTLWSWVQIPFMALMFGVCMCLFCVCVVPLVGSGLATGWSLVQEVLPSVKNDYGTEYEAWALNALEEPLKKIKYSNTFINSWFCRFLSLFHYSECF
jgi:predicted PurR-regulated permease PerM